MRLLAGLLCALPYVCMVTANVEKTVFLAPKPAPLAHVRRSIDGLRLHTLSPEQTTLSLPLAVRFPETSMPHGSESWYLLRGLENGRRYEVRICWPATQPTDFWLDTYVLTHVLGDSDLAASVTQYSGQLQNGPVQAVPFYSHETLLFLRLQAAASYYSTNQTLMAFPSPVPVDIILDPYLLNILPQSLAPFAVYITVVAVGAWFLSAYVYSWLLSVATEPLKKPHTD